MPIARTPAGLLLFSHVPKCAGTSVETYLQRRFGPLAFRDRHYLKTPPALRWSRSSPQHAPASAIESVFPPEFFAGSFAVVRHPLRRLVSVFMFQMVNEDAIGRGVAFEDWVEALPELLARKPWIFDRHVRPMIESVPADAEVIKLEDGLSRVVDYVDGICGKAEKPREMPLLKSHAQVALKRGRSVPVPRVTPRIREIVERLYAADYERFGYEAGPG